MPFERTLAGHEVLRLLATGDRARIWLAAGDRVLKALEPPLDDDQPAREIAALHRASGDHVVELLDFASGDEGVVLVFPRLPRGSLADLLARRASLDAGEAVTVLAPVAASLARMHARGVAHGDVSAPNVLFRADGAPVLAGFGRARLFEPGLTEAALDQTDAVVADRAALALLADGVLARVAGPRAPAAAAYAAQLRTSPHRELEQRLGRELFELAAARPVRFESTEREGPEVRVVPVRTPDLIETPAPASAHGVLGVLLEAGPVPLVRSRVSALWASWSSARRRMVLAGGAGAVAIMVAVTAIPADTPDAEVGSTHPQPTVSAPTDSEPTADVPAASPDEDPLVAAGQLLGRRTECFRDLSVLCFDDVDQPGSAALDDDRAALDALVAEGRQPVLLDAEGATVVETLGDSVLVALRPDSEPASVLLMKGEAGWRIRDYLAGG